MSVEIERFVRLEIQQEHMKTALQDIKEANAETAEKVDKLLAAAAMGQGAWWLALRMGGIAVTLAAALGWLYDHIPGVTK